ncbi:MAG: phenylacetate--CoA ligase family protein [Solirubrobacterales bacterium]
MPDERYWNAEIETMAPADVRALQGRRLEEHLGDLVARSPFYERKFAAAGFDHTAVTSVEALADAPFTEKTELRESQVEAPPLGLHAGVPLRDVIRVHSSSGTTGTPSYVGLTKRDKDRWIEIVSRTYWCEGSRPDDVFIHGFGLGFFVGGLPLKDGLENIGVTFVPIGTGASERLVTSVQALGGTILTCTPSYAMYLAEFIRERFEIEPRELGLKRIMTGGEPGGAVPAVRDRIADAYDAIVTEAFGNADVLMVFAATCDEQDGNHLIAPDQIVSELIDPESGEVLPWEDGAEGELVVTHIERDCVPLVRFRTRDRVRVRTEPCACGRSGPRITCVGRTDDMLIVAGVNVWPSAVSDVVSGFHPRLTGSLQIDLDRPPPAVDPPLRLRVEHGPDERDLEGLESEVQRLLRDRLIVATDVELVPPGTLPRFEMKAQLLNHAYKETGSG